MSENDFFLSEPFELMGARLKSDNLPRLRSFTKTQVEIGKAY
jgi:hypothetical protein